MLNVVQTPKLFIASTACTRSHIAAPKQTSSPKGNDAHLRATIQSEKKWKDQFFRRLRAANSVVRGRIWQNFIPIQALMYVIITFTVVLPPLFCQFILHRKQIECKISIHHNSFVCLFLTAAHAFGTPRPISGSRDSKDVMKLQNVINKQ